MLHKGRPLNGCIARSEFVSVVSRRRCVPVAQLDARYDIAAARRAFAVARVLAHDVRQQIDWFFASDIAFIERVEH